MQESIIMTYGKAYTGVWSVCAYVCAVVSFAAFESSK